MKLEQRQTSPIELAHEALNLISQVGDLLADVESPNVLADVATLLHGKHLAWMGCYLLEQGLHYSNSLLMDGDAPLVSPALQEGNADPVTGLLRHRAGKSMELNLDPANQTQLTNWLIGDVQHRAGAAAQAGKVLLIPVQGRSNAVGLLAAIPTLENQGTAGQIFSETQQLLLQLVARKIGIAATHAKYYRREHQLAETLQRAMLPQQEQITGLDIWTYYAPSSDHAQVGGDWYDVMQVNGQVAGVVIGDVVGHDVEAAAAMGQLRSVVRAYALELRSPATVIERVDTLASSMRLARPASFIYLTLDRGTKPWQIEYSRAGHLPGMLVRGSEVQLLDGGKGPLIGFHGGPRTSESVSVQEGDVLVLYTDGLIERRDRSLKDGMAELARVLQQVKTAEAAAIGEHLLASLANNSQDDIAVVVLRIPVTDSGLDVGELAEADPGPRSRRWQLAPLASSIAQARHAVVRTCAAWQVPDVGSAELVVSELVANAVLHGWGPVTLRLFDTGEGLRIEVEDSNPAPPVITDGHPGRVGGYGVQIVARLSDWGWRSAGEGKVVWAKIRPGADQKIR